MTPPDFAETSDGVTEHEHEWWTHLGDRHYCGLCGVIRFPAKTLVSTGDGPTHAPEHCGCEAEIACTCPCWACNPPDSDGSPTDG